MNDLRLVTFGCSYAFGQCLPDCTSFNDLDLQPSKHAYPSVISRKMRRLNVNKSRPGASNKEITYNIQNFNFMETDIVLIGWTHSNRSAIIKHNEITRIGSWIPEKLSKLYYKFFYTAQEDFFNTKLYYSWANYYLKDKVSKVINIKPIMTDRKMYINFEQDGVVLVNRTLLDYRVDRALDNRHPGMTSHRKYAKYLLRNYIN